MEDVLLTGIAIKPKKRGPMELLDTVEVTVEGGLAGDCRGGGGRDRKRQVAILSLDQWQDTCKELGKELPWQARRANLCVSGLSFGPQCMGRKFLIGKAVILEITSETDPCSRMDDASEGLRNALTPFWRGGVTCRVVEGGTIRLNDKFFGVL